MANFEHDQAEGLRRMLAAPRPRIFTFVSAVSDSDKNATLANLGASLAHAGSDVVLLDAIGNGRGVEAHLGATPAATLRADGRPRKPEQLVRRTAQGFGVAVLGRAASAARQSGNATADDAQLAAAFDAMARSVDVLIVDAEPDADGELPIAAMGSGEVVVLVSPSADSIKDAYSLIKRMSASLGKRPFGVLVTGATEQEAQRVYRNLAQVASQYLALQLHSLGTVPADEHVARAVRLGRTVVDAFPMAQASVAFRSLAGRFCAAGAHLPESHANAAQPGTGY